MEERQFGRHFKSLVSHPCGDPNRATHCRGKSVAPNFRRKNDVAPKSRYTPENEGVAPFSGPPRRIFIVPLDCALAMASFREETRTGASAADLERRPCTCEHCVLHLHLSVNYRDRPSWPGKVSFLFLVFGFWKPMPFSVGGFGCRHAIFGKGFLRLHRFRPSCKDSTQEK